MFDNPGEKLQKLAVRLFVLDVIGSFVGPYWYIRTITAFEYYGKVYHGVFNVPLYLGLVIGLLLTSYISCLVLYGLGEAIENTTAIKWKIDNNYFTDDKERYERAKESLSK